MGTEATWWPPLPANHPDPFRHFQGRRRDHTRGSYILGRAGLSFSNRELGRERAFRNYNLVPWYDPHGIPISVKAFSSLARCSKCIELLYLKIGRIHDAISTTIKHFSFPRESCLGITTLDSLLDDDYRSGHLQKSRPSRTQCRKKSDEFRRLSCRALPETYERTRLQLRCSNHKSGDVTQRMRLWIFEDIKIIHSIYIGLSS